MIHVRINGREKTLPRSMTVSELLRLLEVQEPATAVAVNHTVIPRARWDQEKVREGDRIEIIRIVAGGRFDRPDG